MDTDGEQKIDTLLNKYHSTVFDCNVSSDTRYISCSFKHCVEHGEEELYKHTERKPCWMLNTTKNVNILERHVGNQMDTFIKEYENAKNSNLFVSDDPDSLFRVSANEKVLIVFNVKDYQSQLGSWISPFLKAAYCKDGRNKVKYFTFGFSSRKELFQCITNLRVLPQSANVMIVLSCHSSSQGQVFSCTPTYIKDEFGFEEFCSLHDFVCACCDVFATCQVIHVSSCFTLKIDSSHAEWPVDAKWLSLKSLNNLVLSGSSKEVYETGSQVADLYMVLSAFSQELDSGDFTENYIKQLTCGRNILFKDLADEMGLNLLNWDMAQSMLSIPEANDQVTQQSIVSSKVQIILITMDTDDLSCIYCNSNNKDRNSSCSKDIFLCEAIICNLNTRCNSDVQHTYHCLHLKSPFEPDEFQNSILIISAQSSKKEILCVCLSYQLGRYVTNIYNSAVNLYKRDQINFYGIHFYSLSEMQTFHYLKKFKSLNDDIVISVSCATADDSKPWLSFPALLYLIHLAIGENGPSKFKDPSIAASSTQLSSNERWRLTDVVMETSFVLYGLCQQIGLKLLIQESQSITNPETASSGTGGLICTNGEVVSVETRCVDKTDSSPQLLIQESITNLETVSSNTGGLICTNDAAVAVENRCFDGTSSNISPQLAKSFLKDTLSAENGNSSQSTIHNFSTEDLPLMANVDEVLIKHYILDLNVDFATKTITGSVILFITPANSETSNNNFHMCLDSTLVHVDSVEEIHLNDNYYDDENNHTCIKVGCRTYAPEILSCKACQLLSEIHESDLLSSSQLKHQKLSYAVYGWCIRIWRENQHDNQKWPRCVRVKYRTAPEGLSLQWASDQDGNPCVFSPGAYINNRSLMPCQEPPVAMASWQAIVKVPNDYVVVMSGERITTAENLLRKTFDDNDLFYYNMPSKLPASTLAITVGKFKSIAYTSNDSYKQSHNIQCSIYASNRIIESASPELLHLCPKYIDAACKLLGTYPYDHLDIVILPRSFACMGIQSLLIGAKDWNEEWLSEGFATYLEDQVQLMGEKFDENYANDLMGLRKLLKFKCLKDEMREVTDDSLKALRPKKTKKYFTALEAVKKSVSDKDNTMDDQPRPYDVLQGGAISSRKWCQVHYLKGYFLLCHMANLVGKDDFHKFLKHYVNIHQATLVTSETFFICFIEYFKLSSDLFENLTKDWLESKGIPSSINITSINETNMLFKEVEESFQKWKKIDTQNKRNTSRKSKRRKIEQGNDHANMIPEQLVLLLEKLLEKKMMSMRTLSELEQTYQFATQCAEVRHRWCELIVKHRYAKYYDQVHRFLCEDQGMGVYLFGELVISGLPSQRKLVEKAFNEINNEMDRSTYQTVKEMLEPT